MSPNEILQTLLDLFFPGYSKGRWSVYICLVLVAFWTIKNLKWVGGLKKWWTIFLTFWSSYFLFPHSHHLVCVVRGPFLNCLLNMKR
jgi:hypothetical protein